MIRRRGFTLIELLVAISIFGLVSLIAFSGLESSLRTRERVEAQSERLSQLQKSFHLMRQDFEQAVPRTVRDKLGDPGQNNAFLQVQNGVLFTHGGRENPLNLARSNMERIGWGIKDGKLVRARWQALDPAFEEVIDEVAYLEDVEEFRVRFLNDERRWLEQWPAPNAGPDAPPLPRAVEVNVTLKDMGTITRVYVLPF